MASSAAVTLLVGSRDYLHDVDYQQDACESPNMQIFSANETDVRRFVNVSVWTTTRTRIRMKRTVRRRCHANFQTWDFQCTGK